MKKAVFIFIGLLCCFIPAFLIANNHQPIIKVGVGEFPPYNYIDKDGKLKGIEADLIRLMGDKMGFKPEFKERS